MTLDEAKSRLNCKRAKELAAILQITPEAVSQWDPDCIPELRKFQVIEKEIELQILHAQTLSRNCAESNV